MTSTRTILQSPVPRAVAIAVAAVATAGLLLGLLAGALGESGSAAPAAAPAPGPAAASAPAPTVPGSPTPSAPSAETPRFATRHVVAAGETLAGIAQRYGVPTALLAADNGVRDPDRVVSGTTLSVATPPSDVVVVHAGDTLGELATSHGTTVGALVVLNPQIGDPDRITAGDGLRVPATG